MQEAAQSQLTTLRNEYTTTINNVTQEQDKLTRLNTTIREARASGDAALLRQTLGEANESKLLLDALREHSESLRPQISALEQAEAAKRQEARRRAKVENLVSLAEKAKARKQALDECDKKISETFRALILEHNELNQSLKNDIIQFFEAGEKYAPSFMENYNYGGEASSEARALLREVRENIDTSALFTVYGEHGSRVWQTLANPATRIFQSYPVSDAIASHLPPLMRHTVRQEFFRLQPLPLESK